jgi:Carboxylesterase family
VFSAVNVARDLTYGSAPDAQGNPVQLKLDLYQPAGDTAAERPALIWVHGGGFTAGDKSSGATQASFFARRGYVAASINYRLLSGTGCGATRTRHPSASRGGHLALVDWRPEDPGNSGNPGFSSATRAAVSVSGGTPTNEAIDEDDPPAIFFHGSEDRTVPFEWAVRNAAAMYGAGIFTVLEVIDGAGHGLGWTTQIQEQSDYFLYYALDLAHAQS